MSKLAQKFLLRLSVILVLVILCSLYLNSNFIERYFLHREKQALTRICQELRTGGEWDAAIARLEGTEDVFIVQVENTADNELLNTRLRAAFRDKGLGFQKLWLWEPDQNAVTKNGVRMRLYGQEKLRYSLLVAYMELDEAFVAAVKIIPAMASTIALVNFATAAVFSGATLVMLTLISLLIRKITAPLAAIGDTARAIASLDFQTVTVKTGDELELLADDINDMSGKLQAAHNALETKNLQMETLLANVSHDLKTPVSLIKAYGNGIRDGMDDGTFLDTILLQNEKMEQMITRLLHLAKIQNQTFQAEPVCLSALLHSLVAEQQRQADERGLSFHCEIAPDVVLNLNAQAVQTILSNLISNAVQYADGGVVVVTLKQENGRGLFQIQNGVSPEAPLEPERLWEPFYVGEASRNKNLSGTGLGLSIVRATAQQCGYDCACALIERQIRFTVKF